MDSQDTIDRCLLPDRLFPDLLTVAYLYFHSRVFFVDDGLHPPPSILLAGDIPEKRVLDRVLACVHRPILLKYQHFVKLGTTIISAWADSRLSQIIQAVVQESVLPSPVNEIRGSTISLVGGCPSNHSARF